MENFICVGLRVSAADFNRKVNFNRKVKLDAPVKSRIPSCRSRIKSGMTDPASRTYWNCWIPAFAGMTIIPKFHVGEGVIPFRKKSLWRKDFSRRWTQTNADGRVLSPSEFNASLQQELLSQEPLPQAFSRIQKVFSADAPDALSPHAASASSPSGVQ